MTYSDDESMASSRSSSSSSSRRSAKPQRIAREQEKAGTAQTNKGNNVNKSYVESDDEPPEVVSSASSFAADPAPAAADKPREDGDYHGPVKPSKVPIACLERCAIFIDAALFDPKSAYDDANARVVECSMRVVHYPFCRPTTAGQTATLLYTPVLSASNMIKVQRAITAQRWGQLITTQHGIPCTANGTNTGFEELRRLVRTYRAHIEEYCHTLQDSKKAGSGGGGAAATTVDSSGANITVALDGKALYDKLPDLFWETVNAAVEAEQASRNATEVAFLTTQDRYEEVCKCLMWLQTEAEVSLPSYQVFTIAAELGDNWEALVASKRESCSCGYHRFLMTNNYGNQRHCCEGTVTAMMSLMMAATQTA